MALTVGIFPRFKRRLDKNASAVDILNNSLPIIIVFLSALYCLYNVYLSTSLIDYLLIDFFQFLFVSLIILSIASRI
jgi:hypothetical protein